MLATLATAVLLVSIVGSSRPERRTPAGGPRRRDRRRRTAAGRPDPREALALVGDALAATHNPRALLPVILNVITEATGVRGGRILHGDREIGWGGEVADDADELEF